MGDKTQGGMSSSKGDVKIPVSEEEFKLATRPTPRFDKVESKKFALDYEEELEKVPIIKIKLKDSRELLLIDEQDKEVYNKIRVFVEENPHATLLDTVEHFQKFPTSDAIARVVLEYKYPDFILKHTDSKDSKNKNLRKRENFERLLLRSGLILEQEEDETFGCTYVKVFAPFERLCDQAKTIKLKMRLDSAYLPDIDLDSPPRSFLHPITKFFTYEVNFKKQSAIFRRDRLRQFEGAGPDKSIGDIILNFFPSSRRILMVHRIIVTANQINRKIEVEGKPVVVKRTVKTLAINNLLNDGIFVDFYPIHDGPATSDKPLDQMNLRAQLNKFWVQPRGGQPLDKIRLYFGEKMALYFAWLGFYTSWLSVASIVGIIVTGYGLLEYYVFIPEKSEEKKDFSIVWDNVLTAPFAFFMAVWSSCFLETWKRYNISVAYDWDVMEFEKEELPRPEFYGTDLKKSPITLKQEIHFPFRERVKKFIISGIVVLLSVLIVIVSVTTLLLAPKLWINLGEYTSWVTGISNLIIIFYMAWLYSYVADFLTSFENHRTDTSYEDSMILKSFFFDFVNCYTGLVYILIFKEKLIKNIIKQQGITGCDYNSCMRDLSIQLAILFIGRQMFGQFNEIIWPWFRSIYYKNRIQDEYKRLVMRYKNSGKTRKEIPQWGEDDKLYSAQGSVKGEYEEMVVQFGFISLFGIAFPLAPFFAWINNVIEIRSDAFKYVFSLQRTTGSRVQDIGRWEEILNFISLLSVLTNALIMAFHSTWMRNKFAEVYGDNESQILAARLLFILIFENLVFLVKLIFYYGIPDVPKEIQIAIDRENYLSRLALEDEVPALDEYLSQSKDDASLFDEEGELRLPKTHKAFITEEDK